MPIKNVLILTSGGIDSTACINFYKDLNFNILALFIGYGQKAYNQELAAVTSITNFYKVKLHTVNLSNPHSFEDGEVIGRNALLIFTALLHFPFSNGLIAIGVHRGTPYYDCSEQFLEHTQLIINNYSGGSISLAAPFKSFNKMEVFKYATSEKLPLNLSYSCELGLTQPCHICSTCKDLDILYASKN